MVCWPSASRCLLSEFRSNREWIPSWMNVVRAISSEGFGRTRYHTEIRRRLDSDPEFKPFFNQETSVVPRFYTDRIRRQLGDHWEWLPSGAIDHDPNAYLNSAVQETPAVLPVQPIGPVAAELA